MADDFGFGTYTKNGETRPATSATHAVNLEARGWSRTKPKASKPTAEAAKEK